MPTKNTADVYFQVLGQEGEKSAILMYSQDPQPTSVSIDNESTMFQLRHRRYSLPLGMHLKDFRMTTFPGVQKAKSYEITVEIDKGRRKRNNDISGNRNRF